MLLDLSTRVSVPTSSCLISDVSMLYVPDERVGVVDRMMSGWLGASRLILCLNRSCKKSIRRYKVENTVM